MQRVVKTTLLLTRIVQLSRLLVRLRRGHEVARLLILKLCSQLEDFLMLLVLGLIVLRQLSLLVIDRITQKSAFILRTNNVVTDALHLDLFSVQSGLRVHNFSIGLVTFMGQLCI